MADYTARMDWALEFQRTGKFPLDASSVFESYADAVKYAKGDMSDPDSRGLAGTSYVGQVISVVTDTTATVYKIKGDRTLEEVGRIPDTDGASIEVKNGNLQLVGFDAAKEGQLIRVKNVGTKEESSLVLEFYTPSEVDIDDLQKQVDDIDAIVGKPAKDEDPATGLVKAVADLDTTKADKETTYTKTEIDAKLKGAIHFKDTYDSLAALKAAVEAGTVKPEVGDMYNIRTAGGTDVHGVAVKAGDNVVYVQTAEEPAAYGWDNVGGDIDLSDYYNKSEVDTELAKKVDKEDGKGLLATSEATRLETLTKIEASETNGNIKSTNKAGTTSEIEVYRLPKAGTELGGIKSTEASEDNANKVTVASDGTASVENVDPATLTGAVAEATKVGHKMKVGTKEFDGSSDVEVLANDIPLPTNVAKTDSYGTESVGGTVKSSSAQDKVAIGTDGVMSVNDISASKVKGAVSEASKVTNKLKFGTGEGAKEFDGSAEVTITADDLPLPDDLVHNTDYGTATKGGTVKSSAEKDKVAIETDGTMTLNKVSGSKVDGAVDTANKLGGVAAEDILAPDASNELTSKVKAAAAADKLANGKKVELDGDVTGTVASWDGSTDLSVTTTLKDSLESNAGTYTKVTVNKKGIVTKGENLTADDVPTLTLAKISDAKALAGKDKVAETDLDSDFTSVINSLKTNEHTHTNKTILDAITQTKVDAWDTVGNKADKATTLAGYGIGDAYTKNEIDGMLTGAFHYKDSYATFAALTAAIADGTIKNPAIGDVYNIQTAGGTDRHGTAIKAGDNVVIATVGDDEVTWDVLSGTVDLAAYATSDWVTQNFAGKTEFNSLKETVVGTDGNGGLKAVVGDTSSGLVKDVNGLKDTVGDTTKGLVKDVAALKDTVGDSTSGLVEKVTRLDGDESTTGSVKNLIKGATDTLNKSIDDITKDNGTIDTKIKAHNEATDAHAALFAKKQNKAIQTAATFAVADFVANTDTGVDAAYMATKAIADLDTSKTYWCSLAVDGKSITSAISAKFVPLNKVEAGKLTVYSNAVPTAPVTVNGKFEEMDPAPSIDFG